jgi:hypothetical protein
MKQWTSIWSSRVRNTDGRITKDHNFNLNLRTNAGVDWQAAVMAGHVNKGEAGTATSTNATSLTNSLATFPTSGGGPSGSGNMIGYAGKMVFAGPNVSGTGSSVYGVITKNTGTQLTVDMWQQANAPGVAATTANGTCTYHIAPGAAPGIYLALSTTVQSGNVTDLTLAGECTNASNPGMQRAIYTTYAHSNGTNSYSLSKTFTCGAVTTTVNSGALFNASWDGIVTDEGIMIFEFAETSPPTLVTGDTLSQTVSVSY